MASVRDGLALTASSLGMATNTDPQVPSNKASLTKLEPSSKPPGLALLRLLRRASALLAHWGVETHG